MTVIKDKEISRVKPKEMVAVFSNNPPIHANSITEKHYVNSWIQASGQIFLIQVGYKENTFFFHDEDNISIAARFNAPVNSDLSQLNKGQNISVIGQISSVTENIVILKDCELVTQERNGEKQESNQKYSFQNNGNIGQINFGKTINATSKVDQSKKMDQSNKKFWKDPMFIITAIGVVIAAATYYLMTKST